MPKTKNAFAMRELYTTIFEGFDTEENAFVGFEKTQERIFKGIMPVKYAPDDLSQNFNICSAKVERLKFLQDLIQRHIFRLSKIGGKILTGQKIFSDEKKKAIFLRNQELVKRYDKLREYFLLETNKAVKERETANENMKRNIQLRFSNRLRQARKNSDYSQAETAKWLCMKQNSYSQYETGINQPPLSALYLLAKKFKVSVDWLLGVDG